MTGIVRMKKEMMRDRLYVVATTALTFINLAVMAQIVCLSALSDLHQPTTCTASLSLETAPHGSEAIFNLNSTDICIKTSTLADVRPTTSCPLFVIHP